MPHLFNDIVDIGVQHEGALAIMNWAIYAHVVAVIVTLIFIIRRSFAEEAQAKLLEEKMRQNEQEDSKKT